LAGSDVEVAEIHHQSQDPLSSILQLHLKSLEILDAWMSVTKKAEEEEI
jgi:hypothetical protein